MLNLKIIMSDMPFKKRLPPRLSGYTSTQEAFPGETAASQEEKATL